MLGFAWCVLGLMRAERRQNKAKQDDLFGFLENQPDQEKLSNSKGKEPADINQENINGHNRYWDEKLKQFSMEELMGLCSSLDSKLKILRERIRVLQNNNEKEIKAKAVQVSNNNWGSTYTNPNNDHDHMHITVIDHNNGGDHDDTTITDRNYYRTMMMNECYYHQPLLPLLMFTHQLSYNQEAFESPFNHAAVRPSNGGGRSSDFGREEFAYGSKLQ